MSQSAFSTDNVEVYSATGDSRTSSVIRARTAHDFNTATEEHDIQSITDDHHTTHYQQQVHHTASGGGTASRTPQSLSMEHIEHVSLETNEMHSLESTNNTPPSVEKEGTLSNKKKKSVAIEDILLDRDATTMMKSPSKSKASLRPPSINTCLGGEDLLSGPCVYKSGWARWSATGSKVWVQLRHFAIFWYTQPQHGWNEKYSRTEAIKTPDASNGTPIPVEDALSIANAPEVSWPPINIPNSRFTVGVGRCKRRSKKGRASPAPFDGRHPCSQTQAKPTPLPSEGPPRNPFAPQGCADISSLQVSQEGRTVFLNGISAFRYYQNPGGSITIRKGADYLFERSELEFDSSEQAESWVQSLELAGAENRGADCCCVVS